MIFYNKFVKAILFNALENEEFDPIGQFTDIGT